MLSSFLLVPSLPLLAVVSLFSIATLTLAVVSDDTPPPFYTCDELTPDLCELHKEEGKLTIKGIPVAYWKYTAATSSHHHHQQPHDDGLFWPIVAIHGGPSFCHNYILPWKQQACRGRTIYFYDQAGCGKSPIPSVADTGGENTTAINYQDDYPWLLDPLYYATEELPALLHHWKMDHAKYHIVASSWGTMLSQLYALDAKDPSRGQLGSMVLSGPLSDSHTYIQAQWDEGDETGDNLGGLPPFIQQRIHYLEEHAQYASQEYQALNDILTTKFTLRTAPAPDCMVASDKGANNEIYAAMQGPSEFTMSGVLSSFNVTGRLHTLTDVPVLLSHGKYDTMRPSIVRAMKEALPRVQELYLTKSGHCSMIDEPGKMNDGIAAFYDQVEAEFPGNSSSSRHHHHDHDRHHHHRHPWSSWLKSLPFSITEKWRASSWPPLLGDGGAGAGVVQDGHNHQSSPQQQQRQLAFHTILSLVAAIGIGFVLGEYNARRRMRSSYTHIV